MRTPEQRLDALERQVAADLTERMIAIAAAELGVTADELRRDVQRLAVEARGFPTSEAHLDFVAGSLSMSIGDFEREAERLEAAALADVTV